MKKRKSRGVTSLLPLFPEYKFLAITDRPTIHRWTSQFLPYSDYNFESLFSYDTENDIQISELYGNLVIRFRDYITSEPFYSFLGHQKTQETTAVLLTAAKKSNYIQHLKLIAHDVIQNCPQLHDSFLIKEDSNNHDYILSLDNLSKLEGGEFHTHRKMLHRFKKNFPTIQATCLDLLDKKVRKDIATLFTLWVNQNNKNQEDSKKEWKAIEKLLSHASDLSLFAIGLYSDHALIGFYIVDTSHPQYAESHFTKFDRSYDGAKYFLRKHLADELLKKNYKYLNIEQDLGESGLRFTKNHWNPVFFLKKYIISAK